MSVLSPEALLTRMSELTGRAPDDLPPAPASSNGETPKHAEGIPDEAPTSLRRLIEQSYDRSAAHQAFVTRCVALGLDEDTTVALVAVYRPSRDKYGDRLADEARRSWHKSAAWLKRNPDVANAIRNDEPGQIDASLYPVDLVPVLAGEVAQPMPSILTRTDGAALWYRGMVNGVHGDSGIGKGWVVCHGVAQQINAGNNVMVLDFEDVAASFTARLTLLGCDPAAIAAHAIYIRPQVDLGDAAVAHLVDIVKARDVTMVAIDSLGEAFGLEGIDENKDVEVGPWLRRVARVLAEAGPAVALIDHATKAADNPLHPSGSKRKRAAIGGASYLITIIAPLVKGRGGRLRLTCAKDRHGNFARGETVANLVMRSDNDGSLHIGLHPPSSADNNTTAPIVIAARAAVRAVKAEGKPMTQSAVLAAMTATLKASNDVKRGGIDLAVGRGALLETIGPRNARLFTYDTDLPEPSEATP